MSGNNIDTLNIGLKIPLFSGFSRAYDQQRAEAQARSANAQVENVRQQVVLEVFSSYYAMQTAARRVATADDLLASASQSAEVALGRYKAGVGIHHRSAHRRARSPMPAPRPSRRARYGARRSPSSRMTSASWTFRGESPLRITVDSSVNRK